MFILTCASIYLGTQVTLIVSVRRNKTQRARLIFVSSSGHRNKRGRSIHKKSDNPSSKQVTSCWQKALPITGSAFVPAIGKTFTDLPGHNAASLSTYKQSAFLFNKLDFNSQSYIQEKHLVMTRLRKSSQSNNNSLWQCPPPQA